MTDMTNINQIDDLPDQPGVQKYDVRFKYLWPTDPVGSKCRIFSRRFVGSRTQVMEWRDHHRYWCKRGFKDGFHVPLPWEEGESRAPGRIQDGEHTYTEMWERLKEWRQARIDANRRSITQGSWETQKQVMRDHVVPALSHLIVERTDANALEAVVNRWGDDYLPDEYSPATLNNWIRYLKGFWTWVSDELQIYDPSGRLTNFHVERENGTALTYEQADKLFEVMREQFPQIYAVSFVSCWGGGLRWTHVSALRWEDIDEVNGLIRIERKQRQGVVRAVSTSDKKGAPAALPLHRYKAVLDWHRQWMEDSKHQGRTSPYMFPVMRDPAASKYNGLWTSNKSYGGWLTDACKKAGVPRITHHDWRRTFNTIVLEHSGKSSTVIRKATGHKTEDMTLRYYRQSAEVFDELLGEVHSKAAGHGNTTVTKKSSKP